MEWRKFIVIFCFIPFTSFAKGKLEILWAPFYSLNATNSSGGSQSVSSFGSYRLGYRHPIKNNFELTVGYTVILATDLAYGIDGGIDWFFLTRPSPIEESSGSVIFSVKEVWRPYVGLTFAQRQFQQLTSQLAGFGLRTGFERSMKNKDWSFKGELRYLTLDGSGSIKGDEIQGAVGLIYEL